MRLEDLEKVIPATANLRALRPGQAYIMELCFADIPIKVKAQFLQYLNKEFERRNINCVVLDGNTTHIKNLYEVSIDETNNVAIHDGRP